MSGDVVTRLVNSVELIPIEAPKPDDSGLPYATHFGTLRIGEVTLDVVQLNTGERLITEDSLLRALNMFKEGK